MDTQTPSQRNTHPRPPHHQQCHPNTTPPRPPPPDQAREATRGSLHQPIDIDAPADADHRESLVPGPQKETPSPDPTRDNDDHPPQPTPPPPSHLAPPATAPAEPYALHNPAAVLQHPRGLGDQKVLRLRISGTTQCIRTTTLVQVATLGKSVRDFLFHAFLHVARHNRPPLTDPDGESPPGTGHRIWVPPIDWGRHLVGHPMPGRVNTKGRTPYQEPNMAHPPPSATPSDTKEWKRETWVARMASLSSFRHQVPGDVPTPANQQPAPSTYMTLMYNLHYTLSTNHYHAPTGHWVVHGTDSLLPADYAPPPAPDPGLDTYTRENEQHDPHLWCTWERKSLHTLLSIRSGNQGLGRAIYSLAKWTQRTWGIRALAVEGHAAPRAEGGPPEPQKTLPPTPHLPTALPVHGGSPPHGAAVAGPRHPVRKLPPPHGGGHARHPAMLLPHPRLPPENTPTFLGADMDTPRVTHMPAQPRHRHMHLQQHQHTQVTRESACTRPVPKPAPLFLLLAGPSILRPPPHSSGPSAVPHSPLVRLRLHNLHHHNHLIYHDNNVLSQHSTPQAAGETSQTGPQTRPHRERPCRRQGPRPDEARPDSPAKTQDDRQAAEPKPKPKPSTTTAAQARPPDIRPQPSQARKQQRPARRPPTVTDAAATTFMAERAVAEARRTSSIDMSKPTPQAHRLPPSRPERRQGPPAASPPPYQPSMSAHVQHMPRYRRHRESQPNPEAETVRAYPRVHIRPGPHWPRTPTAQDYEESPWPATATSPHDHITPTHTPSSP